MRNFVKTIAVLVVLTMVLGLFVIGCGAGKDTGKEVTTSTASSGDKDKTPQADTSKAKVEPVTIKMFIFGGDEYLSPLAKEYNEKNPNITVDIQKVSNEYDTVLKTKLNSGEIPDVFMTQGYATNKIYKDLVLDLTNEDFMSQIEDSAKPAATLDGKLYGIPLSMEAYGFIYNKKLFADAGITELPKTYSQLEDAAKKLKAIGVDAFANQYKEWWIFKHMFSQNLSAEEGEYPKIVEELNNGTKKFGDFKEDKKIFTLIDLTLKYSTPKPLETDYATGLALFAQGKGAMVHNGTWAETEIKKNAPSIDIGFLPQPVGEDPSKAKLMVDASALFRISKSSKNIDEIRKLWGFLITRLKETGVGSNIATIKGAKIPDFQLAKGVIEFVQNKQTYPWSQGLWPDGFDVQAGTLLQGYAAKAKTQEQVVDEMTTAWQKQSKGSK